MDNSPQLMTIEFTELDNGLPALLFCSDFTVPITNKTFPISFVNYYDHDLKFKLPFLSGCGLMFKWYDENADILEVYFRSHFMGYAEAGVLSSALSSCLRLLETLQKNRSQE